MEVVDDLANDLQASAPTHNLSDVVSRIVSVDDHDEGADRDEDQGREQLALSGDHLHVLGVWTRGWRCRRRCERLRSIEAATLGVNGVIRTQ